MKKPLFFTLLVLILTVSACSRKAADGADGNTHDSSEMTDQTSGNPATDAAINANDPALGEKSAPSVDCFDKTRAQPSMKCDDDRRPVCGCDGKTYKNACEAGKAGVIHYKWGPCSKATKTAVQ